VGTLPASPVGRGGEPRGEEVSGENAGPPARANVSTLALLGIAIVCVSTATPFIRWAAPAPAATIAAIRVSIAALVLLAVGRDAFVRFARLAARDRGRVLAAGVLLGIHFGVWIASLGMTSTAASVALVATSPVFAALLGALVGDRVGRREWLGIAVAAIGCAVLAGADWRAGGDALAGDALALVGAASGAGYLVIGRGLRGAMPLPAYLALVNLVAGAGLVVVALAAGAPFVGLPAHTYVAIALGALVASVGGHTLLNVAVRRTPTHLVALAVLGEPIGASLLTWAFFAEEPAAHAVAGGAIILAGIAVGFARRG
jgi:drug/metabolite transporter (DMT)-like permease